MFQTDVRAGNSRRRERASGPLRTIEGSVFCGPGKDAHGSKRGNSGPAAARGCNEEVCRIVDEAIAYIQTKFPDAYVGPFETTIQGEYDLCMEVVAGVNRICVEAGAPEVATYVKIFFAPEEGVLTTEEKISKYHENDA